MDIVKSQQTVQTLIMCVIGMLLPCLPILPYIQISDLFRILGNYLCLYIRENFSMILGKNNPQNTQNWENIGHLLIGNGASIRR